MYMRQDKSLFDELVVVGRPISLEDFNLYVFRGLHDEFKDLVTNLATKVKLLSYADLHSHLLTYEFLHKTSLQSIDVNLYVLPRHLYYPLLILPSISIALTSAVTKIILVAISITTATVIATNTSLIFMAFIPLLQLSGSKATGSRTNNLWFWAVISSLVF